MIRLVLLALLGLALAAPWSATASPAHRLAFCAGLTLGLALVLPRYPGPRRDG